MSATDKELEQWLEQPLYPDDDDNERDMFAYFRNIGLGLAILSPILVFAHEAGHALVGMFFGWELTEFVVTWDSGYVRFAYDAILQSQYFPAILVYVAGGVFATLLVLVLSGLYKPMRVWIWMYLPYGLWEGIRGALLALDAPGSMYHPFMNLMEPISNIGMTIMVIMIVYQSFKILYRKPLGNME